MFIKSRKAIVFLLIVSLLMIPMVSCGKEEAAKEPGPADVLSNFVTDYKAQKFDELGKYFESADAMEDFDEEFEDDELSKAMLKELTNIEMSNPEETIVDETNATVKAQFTTADLGGIMEDFMVEVFALAFDEEFADMSDEEMEKMMTDKFLEMLKDQPRKEMEATVNMVKVENEWKIADDNDE